MRNVKYTVLGLMAVFILFFIFQNLEYFSTKQSFTLIKGLPDTPEMANIFFYIIVFSLGVFTAVIFGLPTRFRLKKNIKQLNAAIDSHRDVIASYEKELEELKKQPRLHTASPVETISAPSIAAPMTTPQRPADPVVAEKPVETAALPEKNKKKVKLEIPEVVLPSDSTKS